MATSNYMVVWDPTNKKWTVNIDGAGASDLVENSTAEKIKFLDIAAPAVSAADETLIYMDQTAEKLKISEDGGNYVDVVPVGAFYASWIDPNGTGTKGSWDGYIRTGINFPFACTVTAIEVQVIGGTNAVVNVYKSGAWLRNGHQTVTPTSITSITPLQNTAVSINHELYCYISSLSGAVTQVAFVVHFKRP
jgi:hypothetical protein